MDDRNCAHCARLFTPKTHRGRFCRPECNWAWRAKHRSTARTERSCSECGRSYKDYKGKVCWTCSRQKHAPHVSCEWCGVMFPYMPNMRGARFCSNRCAAIAIRYNGKSTPIPWVECRCGAWVIARPASRRMCRHAECMRERKREQMRNSYARNPSKWSGHIMGMYNEATRRLDIPKASMWRQHLVAYLRARDGDRCGICSTSMRFDLASGPRGDGRAPSIDHVIPRSKGGSDDLANLRLAHWSCNRQRGNRGGNEQLRLVG